MTIWYWLFIIIIRFLLVHSIRLLLLLFLAVKYWQDSLSTKTILYNIQFGSAVDVTKHLILIVCHILKSSFQFQRSNLIICFRRTRLATVCLCFHRERNILRLIHFNNNNKIERQTLSRSRPLYWTCQEYEIWNNITNSNERKQKRNNLWHTIMSTIRKWLLCVLSKRRREQETGWHLWVYVCDRFIF